MKINEVGLYKINISALSESIDPISFTSSDIFNNLEQGIPVFSLIHIKDYDDVPKEETPGLTISRYSIAELVLGNASKCFFPFFGGFIQIDSNGEPSIVQEMHLDNQEEEEAGE